MDATTDATTDVTTDVNRVIHAMTETTEVEDLNLDDKKTGPRQSVALYFFRHLFK